MIASHSDIALIESKFIQQLMDTTTAVEDDFIVTAWSVIKSFFDFLINKKKITRIEWIDFGAFDNIDKLHHIRDLLKERHIHCHHKYKKLHYLYVISRVIDRINELELNKWVSFDPQQKLEYILQPADVTLIEYASKKLSLPAIWSTIASEALKYFSKSIFSHIGLIWYKNSTTWFDWLQSTGHKYYKRSWAWKLPLPTYLKKIWPCEVLITRYKDITFPEQKKIIEKWTELFEQKAWYDTWDAIWDITGIQIFRSEQKMNCGEFVYDCLKVIDESISPTGRSIPGAYLNNKKLEQIYLARIV